MKKLMKSLYLHVQERKSNMAISKKDLEFNKNDDFMRLKISAMERELNIIKDGGGKKRIEKLHSKGKLSARERIDLLLDQDTESLEIGAFAGYEMYAEHGGCPAGGVVIKIGYVSGNSANINGYPSMHK
jgi:3-methylcrotonyl-CoA carboxylase beta subunit